jgi:hypothetical protein
MILLYLGLHNKAYFPLPIIRGHGKGHLFSILKVQIALLWGKHMGPLQRAASSQNSTFPPEEGHIFSQVHFPLVTKNIHCSSKGSFSYPQFPNGLDWAPFPYPILWVWAITSPETCLYNLTYIIQSGRWRQHVPPRILISIYKTTWCHYAEDHNLNNHCLKAWKLVTYKCSMISSQEHIWTYKNICKWEI